MLGFKNFLMEEDGVGVVEMVLIVVVLIGIVVLFKKKLTTLVSDIFNTIKEPHRGGIAEEKGEYYCVCSPFTDAGGAASFHTFRSSETL